jgi:hypothetical protein
MSDPSQVQSPQSEPYRILIVRDSGDLQRTLDELTANFRVRQIFQELGTHYVIFAEQRQPRTSKKASLSELACKLRDIREEISVWGRQRGRTEVMSELLRIAGRLDQLAKPDPHSPEKLQ